MRKAGLYIEIASAVVDWCGGRYTSPVGILEDSSTIEATSRIYDATVEFLTWMHEYSLRN